MAFSYNGFSIREYTSKMRATDITKCWPFVRSSSDDTAMLSKEEVESFLPPMRVAKFRWWSDELAATRSRNLDKDGSSDSFPHRGSTPLLGADDDDGGDGDDDCHAFMEEEEEEVEEEEKRKKKRSIVEIFAVSPRVRRKIESEDEVGNKDGKVIGGAKKNAKWTDKKKKKMKMKSCNLIMKRVYEKKVFKRSKICKRSSKGTRIDQDFKVKLKQKIPSDMSSGCSCIPRCTGDFFETPLIGKEKRASKSLSSQKKRKSSDAPPNFSAKHQKLASPQNPVRGILKRSTPFSSGQGSKISAIECRSLVSSLGPVEKHVRFSISVNDDHRFSRAGTHDERLTDKNGDVFIPRGTEEASVQAVAVDDEISVAKRNRSDCEDIVDVEKLPITSGEETPTKVVKPGANQPDNLDLLEESCAHSQITSVSDQPLPTFDKSNMVSFHRPPYVDYSKYSNAIFRPVDACANNRVDASSLRYDHSGFPSPIFSPHAIASARGVLEPSPVYLTSLGCTNRRNLSSFSPAGMGGGSSHAFVYRPSRPMCSMNMRGSSPTFPADALTTEDFLGLPLNSQGELIRVNSGDDCVLHHAKTSEMKSSCSGVSPYDRSFWLRHQDDDFRLRMINPGGAADQFGSFHKQDLAEKDPFSLGVARSHTWTTIDFCGQRPGSEGNLKGKGIAYVGEHGDCASANSAPLTMRLMGKDVSVSRSSQQFNGHEDEKSWTDKTTIMEHPRPIIERAFFPDKSQCHNEWIAQSASLISEEAESRCNNPYFCRQTSVLLRNGEASAGRYSNLDLPLLRCPNSAAFLGVSGPGEAFGNDSQQSLPSIAHQTCRNLQGGPLGFDYTQNTCCPMIHGAFLYPEGKKYSQPSQLPVFSKDLAPCPHPNTRDHRRAPSLQSFEDIPPWISVSSLSDQGNALGFYYHPHPNMSCRYHSYTVPGNYPNGTVNSLFRGDNSFVPSSPRPPYEPVLARVGPTASQRRSYDNTDVNVRDSMRWMNIDVLGSDPVRSCPNQKPTALKLADPKNQDAGPPYLQRFVRADASTLGETSTSVEIDFGNEKGIWGTGAGYEIGNDGLMMSCIRSGLESDKANETAKLGPTKLTAGAKHILKPSLNAERDDSLPVHSTIPFAGVSSFAMVPDCQMKSAKIYKL